MPLKWTEPEECVWHELDDETFLVVFHVYRLDMDGDPLPYHFRLDRQERDDPFDIRDWPEYNPDRSPIQNVEDACKAGHIEGL